MTQYRSASDYYRSVFAKRTEDELRTLAHIKRAMECVIGDADFRREMEAARGDCAPMLHERGVNGIDPLRLFPFKNGEVDLFWEKRDLSGHPLAKMWLDFITELRGFRSHMREHAGPGAVNPRFDAWRRRQIARCDSQLGDKALQSLVHSIFTFELAKGCSVGCWFCGLSAQKLQDIFRYTSENAALWRKLIGIGMEMFGPAMQCGTCYWATEPGDNPDYLRFLDDYRRITGELPQTTTAVPLRDVSWTREVIEQQCRYRSVPTRFSILSTSVLRRVHKTFSPEELLYVELLHQHQDSLYTKAKAGRARTRRRAAPARGEGDGPANAQAPGHTHQTIACVSGYLVNMVDRSIRLISPCPASDRWPLGYRTHLEGQFDNAAEFREFIEHSIETCMPEHVENDEGIVFRDDLTYAPLDNGFTLTNKTMSHKFCGEPFLATLGALVAEGTRTSDEVIDVLLDEGADIFAVTGAIEELFENGLLDDERFIQQCRKEVTV